MFHEHDRPDGYQQDAEQSHKLQQVAEGARQKSDDWIMPRAL